MSLPSVAPIMLSTPVALRKGGNEVILASIHTGCARSGAFLCCDMLFNQLGLGVKDLWLYSGGAR